MRFVSQPRTLERTMASKLVIVAGLLLLVAAICKAESAELSEETSGELLERAKRGPIGWIIAALGDVLKYFLDGLNIGVKGLLTGLTYLFFGFGAGVSNGLQLWRLALYVFINAVIDFLQNIITLVTLAPLHMNLLGANRV